MAELELEIDFSGRVFFLEFVEYINFTVSHSGACLLRTPTRTSTCANAFLLCRSSRLVPTCGVRISRFLPACVRRKQAHHPPCPSRTGGGVFGRCRCAPRPDPFGVGACPATPLTIACAPQGRARLSQGQQTIPGSSATFFSSIFSSCPSLCLHI